MLQELQYTVIFLCEIVCDVKVSYHLMTPLLYCYKTVMVDYRIFYLADDDPRGYLQEAHR